MKVNNFYSVHEILSAKTNPHTELDLYLVEIIKRKKDNPELKRSERRIHQLYLPLDELLNKERLISELCDDNNARAYIYINRRNRETVAKRLGAYVANQVAQGSYVGVHAGTYNSVAAKFHSEPKDSKLFIVDVDTENENILTQYIDCLSENLPFSSKVYALPTKSGFHLICEPFNRHIFLNDMKKRLESAGEPTEINVGTDTMTLLYFPDQLDNDQKRSL